MILSQVRWFYGTPFHVMACTVILEHDEELLPQ